MRAKRGKVFENGKEFGYFNSYNFRHSFLFLPVNLPTFLLSSIFSLSHFLPTSHFSLSSLLAFCPFLLLSFSFLPGIPLNNHPLVFSIIIIIIPCFPLSSSIFKQFFPPHNLLPHSFLLPPLLRPSNALPLTIPVSHAASPSPFPHHHQPHNYLISHSMPFLH